jgi:hypothetical protein
VKRTVPLAELDRLDVGAQTCDEIRSGTYQVCWRESKHDGPHVSQDRQSWARA